MTPGTLLHNDASFGVDTLSSRQRSRLLYSRPLFGQINRIVVMLYPYYMTTKFNNLSNDSYGRSGEVLNELKGQNVTEV